MSHTSALAHYKEVKSSLWESPTRLKFNSICGHGREIHCCDKEEWDSGTQHHVHPPSRKMRHGVVHGCTTAAMADLQVHHIASLHYLSHLSWCHATIHTVCTLYAHTHTHVYLYKTLVWNPWFCAWLPPSRICPLQMQRPGGGAEPNKRYSA